MKIAAMVLGILGGLFGCAGAVFALFIGGVGGVFGAEGATTVTGLGFAAIPLAIVGMVGGALALPKPKLSGILMLISAVGGVIAISAGYMVAGPLLFIGGLLSLFNSKSNSTVTKSI